MLLMMHMTGTRPLYLQTSGIIRFKLSLAGFLKVFVIRSRIILIILTHFNRICLDSQDNIFGDNIDSVSVNKLLMDSIMNSIDLKTVILLPLMRVEAQIDGNLKRMHRAHKIHLCSFMNKPNYQVVVRLRNKNTVRCSCYAS